jgi:hypothetical protein
MASRIEFAYETLYARKPTLAEIAIAEHFLADASSDQWQQYAHSLLINNEMLMVD